MNKVFALLLVLVMVIGLCACGDKKAEKSPVDQANDALENVDVDIDMGDAMDMAEDALADVDMDDALAELEDALANLDSIDLG